MFQTDANYEIMARGWGKSEDPGYVKSNCAWKYTGLTGTFHTFIAGNIVWFIPSTMLSYHKITLLNNIL